MWVLGDGLAAAQTGELAQGREAMDFSKEILRDMALDELAPKRERRGPMDHWAPHILLERAAYLRKMARAGNGSASETLREYPRHAAMLSFRSRSGEVEVHEIFADLFCVLAGAATLVTGGTVTGARTVAPGETRGDAIEGGTRQELKAGDVAHVPAGTPHQMLLTDDKTVTCFVLKVQECN
jgi:mannose-6-phosphate isomerase-like protein (cupin superfamily)